MASIMKAMRKPMKEYKDRWDFHETSRNGRGKGHPYWECRACHAKVTHANSPKDPDTAVRVHLREISRHEENCSGASV